MTRVEEIFKALVHINYNLGSEALVQGQVYKLLEEEIEEKILKEHKFSLKDRVDFFLPESGIAIEVKIKGNAQAILKQCRRYCEHKEVKSLILFTARFTGFPGRINDKPVYVLHVSKGML